MIFFRIQIETLILNSILYIFYEKTEKNYNLIFLINAIFSYFGLSNINHCTYKIIS